MAGPAPKVDFVSKIMFVLSAIALLLVAFFLLKSLYNTYQNNSLKGNIDSAQLVETAQANIKPIGFSAAAGEAVAGAAGRSGKEIYDAVCTSCHATGVLDAPKLGDKAAWEARATNGLAGLIKTANSGVGSMPAKGGDPSITDTELKDVIVYILKESGLDLGGEEEAPKATTKEQTSVKENSSSEGSPVAVSAETLKIGEGVYKDACFACHAAGVAGSPKLGDKGAWQARIAQGKETLYANSIGGKGAMPPKGGNMSLSDEKVKAAVDYMVDQSQ